jgi:hypothetical protein
MLSIYTGFLASPADMEDLSDAVESYVGGPSHKADRRNTSKQTWFALTGSCLHKNMYETRMPFLLRASADAEYARQAKCCMIIMSLRACDDLHVPESRRAGAVLLSGTLRLHVKEEKGDEYSKHFLFWDPPRDFDQLKDEPPPNCFVELFYDDLRYVSPMPEEALERRTEETRWGVNWRRMLPTPPPAMQRLWGSFRKTFEKSFSEGDDCGGRGGASTASKTWFLADMERF